jgi:hypothetical protein
MWSVLRDRAADLDDGLRDALRADSMFGDRGGNPPGTREYLDFDPILDSQDPCPKYEVVEARKELGEWRVTVKAICADSTWKQDKRPIVVVRRNEGRWKIANFIYPRTDLRSLLCEYAKKDERPENREKGCEPM